MFIKTRTASGQDERNHHHQHHFTTMEQQFDTSKIGMWLFLVTEVLMFGGLFVGFGLMQNRYPREFIEAHEHLKRLAGAGQHRGAAGLQLHHGDGGVCAPRPIRARNALATCGSPSAGLRLHVHQGYEYTHKFEEGLLPGIFYHHKGDLITGSHGYATFFASIS